MNEWLVPAVATVGIIALSAFFVVIEFSLLAARRHRLEDEAAHSASARSAIRGLNQLTVMLAAAQLGITACTFALGAITKPAMHQLLMPAFVFMPTWAADVLAFVLALVLVTFLHLVVGEMTPKSWAIAQPERAAKIVALPAQALVATLGPLLRLINRLANRLVTATGVEPVDRAAVAGYDSETIRSLVEHSTATGTLDAASGQQISDLLGLSAQTVEEITATPSRESPVLPAEATVRQVQDSCRRTGQLRALLRTEEPESLSVVHVRDTLQSAEDVPAEEFARTALVIRGRTSVYDALQQMRAAGEQFAVVHSTGKTFGVITWKDILERVWPGVVSTE